MRARRERSDACKTGFAGTQRQAFLAERASVVMELLSEHFCFGGVQRFYRHASSAVGGPMRFGVFLPPHASLGKVAGLIFLGGMGDSEQTFLSTAGAQRYAAEAGIALISPDTSPRGALVPDVPEDCELGQGAGFYVDATQNPWSRHFRMFSYVLHDLLDTLTSTLPINTSRMAISGHSMGGHGALVLGLRNRHIFKSISAFAPIATPAESGWGRKGFTAYLGPHRETWTQYDASALIGNLRSRLDFPLLVDQGTEDRHLRDQLFPEALRIACLDSGQPIELRRRAGYDHSYYLVSSFIEDHIVFHSRALR